MMQRHTPGRLPSAVRLLLLALAGAPACGTDPGEPVAATVITAPLDSVTLRTLGRQVQFAAEARDASGQVLSGREVFWTISGTAARISASGLLTAVAPGTVIVRALAGRVTSDPVTVSVDPLVVRVAITPDSLTFHTTGRPQAIAVAVLDSSGATLPLVAALAVGDTSVVRLSNGTTVVARSDGATHLVATVDDLADTVPVQVALVPAQILASPAALAIGSHAPRTVTPVVTDSSSHPLPGHGFSFASGDTTIITVSDSGEVTPHGEGSTGLHIAAAGLTAVLPVSVRYVMYSTRVQPSPMTFYTLGRPQRARLYSADSTFTILQLLPDSVPGAPRDVSWHAPASYYTIVPADTGVDVYPVFNGNHGDITQMLMASWRSTLMGYALIIVTLYPATFSLVAPQVDLAVGDTTVFTRVARDSLDNDLEGRILIYYTNEDWSVVTLGEGPVEQSLSVIGLQPGTSWVRMFGGGAGDSVLVTVH